MMAAPEESDLQLVLQEREVIKIRRFHPLRTMIIYRKFNVNTTITFLNMLSRNKMLGKWTLFPLSGVKRRSQDIISLIGILHPETQNMCVKFLVYPVVEIFQSRPTDQLTEIANLSGSAAGLVLVEDFHSNGEILTVNNGPDYQIYYNF